MSPFVNDLEVPAFEKLNEVSENVMNLPADFSSFICLWTAAKLSKREWTRLSKYTYLNMKIS